MITGSVIKMLGAGMVINNYPLCAVKARAEPDIKTTAGNSILFPGILCAVILLV
jgi:hypothetical protein